jgi:hypothetical protein
MKRNLTLVVFAKVIALCIVSLYSCRNERRVSENNTEKSPIRSTDVHDSETQDPVFDPKHRETRTPFDLARELEAVLESEYNYVDVSSDGNVEIHKQLSEGTYRIQFHVTGVSLDSSKTNVVIAGAITGESGESISPFLLSRNTHAATVLKEFKSLFLTRK